jgi:hypothetical protein
VAGDEARKRQSQIEGKRHDRATAALVKGGTVTKTPVGRLDGGRGGGGAEIQHTQWGAI